MDLRGIGAANFGSMNVGSMSLGSPNINGVSAAAREMSSASGLSAFEEALRSTASRNAPQESAAKSPELSGVSPEASRRGVKIDREDELFKQCLELETFLVKNLVGSMRSTIQKADLIDQGFAGKMYEDMLFDEYSKKLTESAGFGLAELAYLELSGQRGQVVLR